MNGRSSLSSLKERLDSLRQQVAQERERLVEIEERIEPLRQQILALEMSGEPREARLDLDKLEQQVAAIEARRRRRIEDELREFHDREVRPRLASDQPWSGTERRSGLDRRSGE